MSRRHCKKFTPYLATIYRYTASEQLVLVYEKLFTCSSMWTFLAYSSRYTKRIFNNCSTSCEERTVWSTSATRAKCFVAAFERAENVGTVAKRTRESRAFVNKWVRRFKDAKTVDDLPERYTKRRPEMWEDKPIVDASSNVNYKALWVRGRENWRKWLSNSSCDIMATGLHDRDVKFQCVVKKPLLLERCIENRVRG